MLTRLYLLRKRLLLPLFILTTNMQQPFSKWLQGKGEACVVAEVFILTAAPFLTHLHLALHANNTFLPL